MEILRKHAHHGVLVPVHLDASANYVWRRAKFSLPQTSGDEHHRCAIRAVILCGEKASANRADAKYFEKSGGNLANMQQFGFSASGDGEIIASVGRHSSKSGIAALPIEKIGVRNRR